MTKIKILPITLIALITIIFFSCTKDVEENILGTWDLSQSTTYGIYTSTVIGKGTFNEDGTGIFTIDDGVSTRSETFTWSSTKDEITFLNSGSSDPVTLDVITNKDDEQEWSGTQVQTRDEITYSVDLLIKLSR